MKSKKTLYIIILLLVALAAYFAYNGTIQPQNGVTSDSDVADEEAMMDNEDTTEDELIDADTDAQARAEDAEETATDRVTSELNYQDGDYQAEGTYTVPNGTEYVVQIEMTIESDTVAAASVFFDDQSEGQTSTNYQAQFLEAFEDQVVGQPLADVDLSRVGGASLTTQAFNDAVVDIRSQAS